MPDLFSPEALRKGLEKARAADPDFKVFGADHHKYCWNPPASPEAVAAFEADIGTALPEGYRSFLLQAGDGGAGPFYGLWPLEQARGWLTWEVEPEKTPYLKPGRDLKAPDEDGEQNWRRGCIPIGTQGDTYFTYLLVAGPDRGRVVYVEYERSWVFFPREPDFLSWYARWLREVSLGYDLGWFGIHLDGDELALISRYAGTQDPGERHRVLSSMTKFPVLSETTQTFLRNIADDWIGAEDEGALPDLLFRVDPALYEDFLCRRWDAGRRDSVLYNIYHSPGDKQALAERWHDRILANVSGFSPEYACLVIPTLRRGGGITFEQAAALLLPHSQDPAMRGRRQNLLHDLGRLPDAREHMDFWLDLLDEREDLKDLADVLSAMPHVNAPGLKEALQRIIDDFPYAQERLPVDRDDPESVDRSVRRCQEADVIRCVKNLVRDLYYEEINPAAICVPRPWRLEMSPYTLADLEMDRPLPPDAVPIHPLIAHALLREEGRLPSTAWDWDRKLKKLKRLEIRLTDETVWIRNDQQRVIHLHAPTDHPLPPPYYYALGDWSAVGRMQSLRELSIAEICVEDFGFLATCKSLRTLDLHNTNFTDCRLLASLPKLQYANLRDCPLTHTEALEAREKSLFCQR